MNKYKFKEFREKFSYDRIETETLKKIIEGDTEISLWNTNIKVYPIGAKYYIEHNDYKLGYLYCVKIYGLAYIGGKVKEVMGHVDKAYRSDKLCILGGSLGDDYDQFPDYKEIHDRAQECLGRLIFNDDGGTTEIAYQKAIENLEKEKREKSAQLIELEKKFEFKSTKILGASDKIVEDDFLKNEEVMKLILHYLA